MDIPVDDIILVKMLQRENKLGDIEPSSILTESSFFLQMPEKLSTTFVIGDKVKFLLSLERELESNKERTFQTSLQNLSLSDGMRYFLLGDNLPLGQNLHGVNTTGVLLSNLEDSTESTSSDELEILEVGWLEVGFVLIISMTTCLGDEFD